MRAFFRGIFLVSCAGVCTVLCAYLGCATSTSDREGASREEPPRAGAPHTETAGSEKSVIFEPHFQIYQNDPQLGDLLPPSGNGGGLCWPSSLAHRMIFFKQDGGYGDLALPKSESGVDLTAAVRKFARLCQTRIPEGGTLQSAKLPCIDRFLRQSGYDNPVAFAIGVAGVRSLPGQENENRVVQVGDLRDAIAKGYGVILHVGWFFENAVTGGWEERGSHSLNAYGFAYDEAWGGEKIILKVANPDHNYGAGPRFLDSVRLTQQSLARELGPRFPSALVLDGPGFRRPGRLAVLEDIFVFSPQKR